MNTATTTVLRQKTAKRIMDNCYVYDKTNSQFFNDGAIDVTGNNINATARHIKGTGKDKGRTWWIIHIESATLDTTVLQSLLTY